MASLPSESCIANLEDLHVALSQPVATLLADKTSPILSGHSPNIRDVHLNVSFCLEYPSQSIHVSVARLYIPSSIVCMIS
jgi:hypothetical protein